MIEYSSCDDFSIIEKARFSPNISEDDIRSMANVTGDFNPVHNGR